MKGRPVSDENYTRKIQLLRRQLKELRQSEVKREHAEEELKESEQRLKSVIGCSPIPAFVIGKDHRILYWNKALEELTTIKAEDAIGTSQQWRAFYSKKRPCMADLLVSHNQENISKWYTGKYTKSKLLDEAYEAVDFFPELGNQGKWLRFTAAIIRNAAGELIGAIETLEDITRRKKAKEALLKAHEELEERVRERTAELAQANEALLNELMERHRTQKELKQTTDHLSLLLESLPIISYTRKAEGDFGITFVSNTIEEITGYPPQCFVEDENFWTYHIHPDDQAMVLNRYRRRLAGESIPDSYEYRSIGKDNRIIWFNISTKKIEWNGRPATLSLLTDITARKLAEEALQARIRELNCLYSIAGLINKTDRIEEILQGAIALIKDGWNYPEITCARITIGDQEFKTTNFKETVWKMSANLIVQTEQVGLVEICYLEEKPQRDEGPFLKEERGLIDAVAERLGRIIERHQMARRLNEVNNILRLISSINQLIVANYDGSTISVIGILCISEVWLLKFSCAGFISIT